MRDEELDAPVPATFPNASDPLPSPSVRVFGHVRVRLWLLVRCSAGCSETLLESIEEEWNTQTLARSQRKDARSLCVASIAASSLLLWWEGIPRNEEKTGEAYAAILCNGVYPIHARAARCRRRPDRKSTRLNSSHSGESRMPSSA